MKLRAWMKAKQKPPMTSSPDLPVMRHAAEVYRLPENAVIGMRGTARPEGLLEVLPRLLAGLEARGIACRISRSFAEMLGDLDEGVRKAAAQALPEDRLSAHCDLILSLGGDGSLLAAVSQLERDLPVLGLHMGSMGYLTATTPEGLENCLDELVTGGLHLEKRMMLRVTVEGGEDHIQADALNDIVLTSGLPGRVVRLTTRINGENLFRLTGDGLIHATPTGSTAYNLGGGGPILDPGMEAIVLTPVMPHSVSVRPIVVSPDARIETRIHSRHGRMQLSVDGQLNLDLWEGCTVIVERSPRRTHLLKLSRPGFIGVLRSKLHWNLEDE